jgi:hypothetical protein
LHFIHFVRVNPSSKLVRCLHDHVLSIRTGRRTSKMYLLSF